MIISKINSVSAKNMNANSGLGLQQKVSLKSQKDTVSFGIAPKEFHTDITPEQAKMIATKLSTSTSGLRSKYGNDIFNDKTTSLLTEAISAKVLDDKGSQVVVVGGDMRHASKVIVPQIAQQMKNNGFNVLYVEKPVATPLLALAAKENNADVTFLMTASHNPWTDGGYNLLTKKAAVADPHFTEPVIDKAVKIAAGEKVQTKTGNVGQIINYDPYPLYKEYLDTKEINGHKIIDFKAIKDAGIDILYDDFGGTGSYYLPRLLEDHEIPVAKTLRTHTEGPEPNAKNIKTLASEVQKYPSKLKIGLANDGDSDRFGIVDEKGNYIPANDILLLMAYHLNKNKGYKKGAILRSGATSSQLDLFAKKNGLDLIITPVGFKYIGEEMIKLENEGNMAVLGGEESGGLTIGGHIPEKDGFVATLAMAELMAHEKKPLSQILKEVKESLGTEVKNSLTSYIVPDKHAFFGEFKKIYDDAISGKRKELFGMPLDAKRMKSEFETVAQFKKGGDGVKICFENGSSMLVRLSGTEDIAKVYKELYFKTPQEAKETMTAIENGVEAIAKKFNARAK